MIDNAMEEGISFSDVTMDGFYEGNTELLTVLENRGLIFVADTAVNKFVYAEKPAIWMPEKKETRGRRSTIQKFLNMFPICMDFLFISVERSKFNRVRKTERRYKKYILNI